MLQGQEFHHPLIDLDLQLVDIVVLRSNPIRLARVSGKDALRSVLDESFHEASHLHQRRLERVELVVEAAASPMRLGHPNLPVM